MSSMERYKTIDIFRGLCMTWMFLGHLLDWWIKPEFFWLSTAAHTLIDSIGASGFLFIAGVSVALSYRHRIQQMESQSENTFNRVKSYYYFRALILLEIALIYNILIAITINSLVDIWFWFVLLTAAISMLISWPLLKLPNWVRIIIAFGVWILSQELYQILVPHIGQSNIYGYYTM
jgi:uncharacterized membrane protein